MRNKAHGKKRELNNEKNPADPMKPVLPEIASPLLPAREKTAAIGFRKIAASAKTNMNRGRMTALARNGIRRKESVESEIRRTALPSVDPIRIPMLRR